MNIYREEQKSLLVQKFKENNISLDFLQYKESLKRFDVSKEIFAPFLNKQQENSQRKKETSLVSVSSKNALVSISEKQRENRRKELNSRFFQLYREEGQNMNAKLYERDLQTFSKNLPYEVFGTFSDDYFLGVFHARRRFAFDKNGKFEIKITVPWWQANIIYAFH